MLFRSSTRVILLAMTWLIAGGMNVFAEQANEVEKEPPTVSRANVGVSRRIDQLVIPGSELEAKPIDDRQSPIVLRILAAYRHGSDYRYDLEYYGLDPGRFDLRDYLQRKDRSSLDGVKPLPIQIETRLPPGQLFPAPPEPTKLPAVGGYRTLMFVVEALWAAGMLWLIFGGRRKRGEVIPTEHVITPAEQLRPLVLEAIAGRLSPTGQAELERVLLRYWRRRLNLEDADPVLALTTIRQHPEAGTLLRLIEEWLHRPGGADNVDVAAILAPYQNPPTELEPTDNPGPGSAPDSPSPITATPAGV